MTEKQYRILFALFSVCLVVLFALVGLLYISLRDERSDNIYQNISNTICVEVITTDNKSVKGTAYLVGGDNVVSVAHLFKDYAEINAKLYGSDELYNMSILKIDEDLDLALLKIDNVKVNKSVSYLNKNRFKYGLEIIKIGNALGYGLSVSNGIVSSPYVKLEVGGVEKELASISIPIYGGDSGGVVFSLNNELVGIISFKYAPGLDNTEQFYYIIPSYIVEQFVQNV